MRAALIKDIFFLSKAQQIAAYKNGVRKCLLLQMCLLCTYTCLLCVYYIKIIIKRYKYSILKLIK